MPRYVSLHCTFLQEYLSPRKKAAAGRPPNVLLLNRIEALCNSCIRFVAPATVLLRRLSHRWRSHSRSASQKSEILSDATLEGFSSRRYSVYRRWDGCKALTARACKCKFPACRQRRIRWPDLASEIAPNLPGPSRRSDLASRGLLATLTRAELAALLRPHACVFSSLPFCYLASLFVISPIAHSTVHPANLVALGLSPILPG
jgi:hypothetical protein